MNFNHGKICLLFATLITQTSIALCSHSPIGIRHRSFSDSAIAQAAQASQCNTPQNPPNSPSSQTSSVQELKNFSQSVAQESIIKALQNLDDENKAQYSPITTRLRAFSSIPERVRRDSNSPNIQHLADGAHLTIQIPHNSIDNEWESGSSQPSSTQGNVSPSTIDRIVQQEVTKQRIRDLSEQLNKLEDCKKSKTELQALQRKNALYHGLSLVALIALSKDSSQPQTRFGLAAAATIISTLPTVLTSIVGGFCAYELYQFFHTKSAIRSLEHSMNELHNKHADLEKKLDKESTERKKGDIESINKITTLTNEVKQTISSVAQETKLAVIDLKQATKNIYEVKEVNSKLAQDYPTILQKLDQILHHASTMRQNMERQESGNYTNDQLNNIEYSINQAANEAEDEKEESDHNKIQARRKLSQATITLPHAPRNTAGNSTPASPTTNGFPAGTIVTPSGHASAANFKKQEKHSGGIMDWIGFSSQEKKK